ncbi:hypothetical protein BDQ17DRAFT_1371921 [Cyathus striatus]|nr:hypothetical protein BDQ17DRAFT_1371921 [Cyathus striatus]
MAFANSRDFSINHATLIDHSNSTYIDKQINMITNQTQDGRLSPISQAAPSTAEMFTGQEQYLEALKKHFKSDNLTNPSRKYFLLYGMGGIGKTQICLKFKDDSEDYFECIFWIDTSSEESTYPSAQSGEFSANARKWLIIYDNADGVPEVVEKFLPPGNRGNILINSRNHSLRRITRNENSMEVKEMNPNIAIELLLKASGIEEKLQDYQNVSKDIVSELCCLPLAIAQAGAYIMNGNCDINNYLKLYRKYRAKLMDNKEFGGASKYDKTVYGTWEISFQKLQRMSEASTDATVAKYAIIIINICAFFHYMNIPLQIFERAAKYYNSCVEQYKNDVRPIFVTIMEKELFNIDEDNELDEYLFNKSISILLSYALIKKENMKYISLHPLVQLWCQDRLPRKERIYWVKNACGILSTSITYKDTTEEYEYAQDITLHILQIISKTNNMVKVNYYFDIFNKFATALKKSGKYKELENFLRKIVQNDTELLGDNDSNTLTNMNILAETYSHLGKWNDAETLLINIIKIYTKLLGEDHPNTLRNDLFVHILELHKKLLGVEHPDTLRSMSNLALSYSNIGKWNEAEDLQLHVLKIHTKLLGNEHPHTLTCMGHLASTYSQCGKWKEAEEMQIHVSEIFTKLLGEEHPDTLKSMSNLASTYSSLGKWIEAENIKKDTLNIFTNLYGEDHPHTLTFMSGLALTYCDLEKWKEAEELQVNIMNMYTKTLGEEHPHTLTSMSYLASTYSNLEKWNEAEALHVHVLKIHTKLLGEDHLDTLTSMGHLAAIYANNERWEIAEDLFMKVYEKCAKRLGENHPQTLRSASNLISVYINLEKWNEAVELQANLLENKIKLLGGEHPDTLASMSNLAVSYCSLEKWNEAEKLQIQIFERYIKLLGRDHLDTLTSMRNLASTYCSLGKWNEAEELQVQILEGHTKLIGENHPDTLTSMNDLAATLSELGKLNDAELLQIHIFETCIRLLGENHPETLRSMNNLAATVFQLGKLNESEQLQVQVLKTFTKLLGEEHPDTIKTLGKLAEAENLKVHLIEIQSR